MGEKPKSGERFVMIQCVGSREEPNQYCSRICCQDAIKNAIAIKQVNPEAQVIILYRDIRTYGLREDYYKQARDLGVIFVRYDVDKKPVVERAAGDRLRIKTWTNVEQGPGSGCRLAGPFDRAQTAPNNRRGRVKCLR